VLIAPQREGVQDWPDVVALRRQAVGITLGRGDALEDAFVHQDTEAVGEHRARDAQPVLKVVELVPTSEDLAQDEQRPPVAHHVGGASEGVMVAELGHDLSVSSSGR
jgi:hypothetical protein